MLNRQDLLNKARHIKLAVFDVDGVMTNGQITYDDQGNEYKSFNALDGFGIKQLAFAKVDTAIITARSSPIIKKRAKELEITYIFEGVKNKKKELCKLLESCHLTFNEVAYLGDDFPDLAAIVSVGLGMCVANAHFLVKERADGVTKSYGGQGAVREFCDLILEGKNLIDPLLKKYEVD